MSGNSETKMRVTVMITTRNRAVDLRRTLDRLHRMSPAADEILVTADGCSDDTVAMLRADFPQCQLLVNDAGLGSIASRDRMLRMATGELVLSLDDDSYPVADDFFQKLLPLFAAHPEAAVITFSELRDDETASKTLKSGGYYVSAYPNGAAAMRRADYLATGGFPSFFVHAYEEPDYALQVYSHGGAVWFEPSLVIRHHYSQANRDHLRIHHLHARNELWSVWMRCPWLWIPMVALFRLWRQLGFAWSEGPSWVVREPLWWWNALKGLVHCHRNRCPVRLKTYFAWMRLAREPLLTRQALEKAFGPRKNHPG